SPLGRTLVVMRCSKLLRSCAQAPIETASSASADTRFKHQALFENQEKRCISSPSSQCICHTGSYWFYTTFRSSDFHYPIRQVRGRNPARSAFRGRGAYDCLRRT